MKQKKGPLNEEQTRKWIARYQVNARRYAWGFFVLLQPVVFGIIWASMGELNPDVFYSWAFFFVVTLLLALYSRRRAARSWRGTVADKGLRKVRVRNYEDQPDQIRTVLEVVFRTSRGKTVKLRSRQAFYDYFTPGDAVVKPAGFDFPEKEEPDGESRVCVACGNVFSATEGNCPGCRAPLPDVKALVAVSSS